MKVPGWLSLIIGNLLVSAFPEKLNISDHMKFDSINVELFYKQVSALPTHIQEKVSNCVPGNFGRVMAGWRMSDMHFFIYICSNPYAD